MYLLIIYECIKKEYKRRYKVFVFDEKLKAFNAIRISCMEFSRLI